MELSMGAGGCGCRGSLTVSEWPIRVLQPWKKAERLLRRGPEVALGI